jgi:acylphosphatase
MERTVRAHVIVSGVVQGVFFRGTTQDEAGRLGLAGWVRNRPEGTVEAVFEGPEQLVREALEWASHGPRSAVVEDIQVEWEEPVGETGFRMRH